VAFGDRVFGHLVFGPLVILPEPFDWLPSKSCWTVRSSEAIIKEISLKVTGEAP